jgi:hypothetical protein
VVIVEPTDAQEQQLRLRRGRGRALVPQVRARGGRRERLVALNRIYPDIELDGLQWHVLGVIIQRNIRRQIKHYDYSQEPATSPAVAIKDLTGR